MIPVPEFDLVKDKEAALLLPLEQYLLTIRHSSDISAEVKKMFFVESTSMKGLPIGGNSTIS